MKLLILFIALWVCNTISAEKRFVWLHGLGGDQEPNTWDIYSSYFAKQSSSIFKYKSDRTIKEIAQKIYLEQLKPIEYGNEVILIGHSMGGLVARYLQTLSPSVKGMVTVGTGHRGSGFLQSALDGKLVGIFLNPITMSNKALDYSIKGIMTATFPVSALAAPLVFPVMMYKNQILNGALTLVNTTVNSALSVYTAYSPCVKDLKPGSELINKLNSNPLSVPLVNVYGAEEYNQFLRAMGSFSQSKKVKNAENLDKEYDEEYFDELNKALSIITQIQNAHDLVYKALAYPAIFMPWIWLTREIILDAKADWKTINNYLRTGIHNDLLYAIDSYEYKLTTYCLGFYKSSFYDQCFTRYIPYQLENDGILSRKDVLMPQDAAAKIYNVKVPNVNHFEMGNQPEMRKLFNSLINLGVYGKIFVN